MSSTTAYTFISHRIIRFVLAVKTSFNNQHQLLRIPPQVVVSLALFSWQWQCRLISNLKGSMCSRSRSYFTTDSQSVCIGIEHPCGTCDQILFPVRYVSVWNLRSCIYWAPSLTRGRVCNLQCNHSMVRIAENPKPYFMYRPVFYFKLNSTLQVCPSLTGNTLRLR
jgi:hypothetical protein